MRSDDRHRKVRVLVTEANRAKRSFNFSGHSLGSSIRKIKTAKKDKPPILVSGNFEEVDGAWKGVMQPA